MRETLYYKDDDMRLSFFQGNYITLTNLSKRDIERIVKLRVSPINVSVHTLDPELREYMLGTKDGAAGVEALETLARAGITLNCQIVCCPGINDGVELLKTLNGLAELGGSVNSVSVVPVGLTKHRQGLARLRPFDRELALSTVRQVERVAEKCLKRRGSRVFFCADELYIKAGLRLPPNGSYEDYPQLENGVGMMRLFITEFENALRETAAGGQGRPHLHADGGRIAENSASVIRDSGDRRPFSIATGMASARYLTNLLKTASEKYGIICGGVYAIRNDFFGDAVTVSGLVTGGDIISQLRGRDLGSRLLIPQNMLRSGDDVFLDNVTVSDVSNALGVTIRVVSQNGSDMLRAFLGE